MTVRRAKEGKRGAEEQLTLPAGQMAGNLDTADVVPTVLEKRARFTSLEMSPMWLNAYVEMPWRVLGTFSFG
jgi:hypothetical protein